MLKKMNNKTCVSLCSMYRDIRINATVNFIINYSISLLIIICSHHAILIRRAFKNFLL